MADDQTPWALVSQLEGRVTLKAEIGRLRLFMASCCRKLTALMPPAAENWLQVAERYRIGTASDAELEEVRVVAWNYLGKESCNFQSPQVLAVRALICLLFPDGYERGEDWGDIVHFFLTTANDAEDHQEEQSQLLRELFPEYLYE